MKKSRKVISFVLCLALVAGAFSTACFAAEKKDINYIITNPYADVDWNTWQQYKADLHSHSTQSDGDNTLKYQVEAHYDYGFDIYALTDHGTTSYSWLEDNVNYTVKVGVAVKDSLTPLEHLEETGTAANGNTYYVESTPLSDAKGDTQDYYWQEGESDGHKMLRVPFGIENNPTSLNNAHVNSWFVDYGNGILGGTSDYETPIKAVDELGGLSVINHPGEYTNARDEDETADAYDYSNSHYKYDIDKFTNLLANYPSCIGIDMNSKGDSRTRYDRKLWDILLMNLTPAGRNVLGICTSDSHNSGIIYSGYIEAVMPELTVAAFRQSLETGAFFGYSKYLGNPEELTDIANYCVNSSNPDAVDIGGIILDAQAENPKFKYEAPFDVDAPVVNSVKVDDAADTITIAATDALCIRWIANGKTIAYGNTIDLDDYSDEIGAYVRAEVFGEGGIVYVEPFVLDYSEAPEANINRSFFDFGFLASAIPDSIVKFIGSLHIFRIIFEALTR